MNVSCPVNSKTITATETVCVTAPDIAAAPELFEQIGCLHTDDRVDAGEDLRVLDASQALGVEHGDNLAEPPADTGSHDEHGHEDATRNRQGYA